MGGAAELRALCDCPWLTVVWLPRLTGPPENRGVNFRALARLFTGIEERTDEVFELEISMLEIYNECVFDLLVEPPRRASDRKKLDIRKVSSAGMSLARVLHLWQLTPLGVTHATQRANGSVFVQGLKRVPVATMETVEEVVSGGSKNRAAGSHDMNEHSSRSHLVLAVYVRRACRRCCCPAGLTPHTRARRR